MKAKQTMAAAGLLAWSATAAAAPATVTVDLNLRSGPGTGHAVMGSFRAGTVVEVEACDGRWCAVSYADVRGYVSSVYLAPVSNPGTGLPGLGLIPLGTSYLGSIIGIEFGTLGAERSYEAGYNPPRRRLFAPDQQVPAASGSIPVLGDLLPIRHVDVGIPRGPAYAPRRAPSTAQRAPKQERPAMICPPACMSTNGAEPAPPPASDGY